MKTIDVILKASNGGHSGSIEKKRAIMLMRNASIITIVPEDA
jgi:hypothetical protein